MHNPSEGRHAAADASADKTQFETDGYNAMCGNQLH